jgi:hypothetical protein
MSARRGNPPTEPAIWRNSTIKLGATESVISLLQPSLNLTERADR